MAFAFQKIAPGDFSPNTGVGINLPFNGPACFVSNYASKDALKNNMINWFLTNKGERLLNPQFGGNLRQFIFEQLVQGTLESIEEEVQQQLSNYFPGVIVEELLVTQDQLTQTVNINLTYTLQGYNIQDNLEIEFE